MHGTEQKLFIEQAPEQFLLSPSGPLFPHLVGKVSRLGPLHRLQHQAASSSGSHGTIAMALAWEASQVGEGKRKASCTSTAQNAA